MREWLAQQAAAGYVAHDGTATHFDLDPEAAATLASPGGPADLVASFHIARALMLAVPRIAQAFRDGGDVAWGDHDACAHCGTARHFGGIYQRELVREWLPAVDGAVATLARGTRVADFGCGRGVASMLLAESRTPRNADAWKTSAAAPSTRRP